MGRAKERYMELQERGYGEVPEKFVCEKCFGDEGLKEFIGNNGERGKCSYCNDKHNRFYAVISLEAIIGHIMERISFEWRDAADSGTPYESREGGYLGPTSDIYDILMDEEPIEAEHSELFNDIVNATFGQLLARPFAMPYEEMEIQEDWHLLTQAIKYHARFIIFHDSALKIFDKKFYSHLAMPKDTIDELCSAIERLNLITKLDKNIQIYRARHSETKYDDYSSAKDIGTVPSKAANQANRMSPVGISMFYGALDTKTAKLEIEADKKSGYIHYGTFFPSRDLVLIDFTKIPFVPSIYSNRYHLRSDVRLMRDFVKDFSKQILRVNNAEHIEYIPTQVITEYLRYNFTHDGKHIDGIIYNSVHKTGKSCVLFVDNDHCVNKNIKSTELCLILDSYCKEELQA